MKPKIEMCCGKSEANSFKEKNDWFQRFKKRHGLVLTRRKLVLTMEGKSFRNFLKTHRRRNRYNVDQVPLPFVVDPGTTYATVGNKQVWVSQPSSSLHKRQATL